MEINNKLLRKALKKALLGGSDKLNEVAGTDPPPLEPDISNAGKYLGYFLIFLGVTILISGIVWLLFFNDAFGDGRSESSQHHPQSDLQVEPDTVKEETAQDDRIIPVDSVNNLPCKGGLVVPNCNINTGDDLKNETDCPDRFVKWPESSTGFMQCQWESARNQCNMWSLGESISDGNECFVEGESATCHSSTAWQGVDAVGIAGPITRVTEQAQCSCPDGTSIQNHATKNVWRCL